MLPLCLHSKPVGALLFVYSLFLEKNIKIYVQYLQCFWVNFHDGENQPFKGVVGIQITGYYRNWRQKLAGPLICVFHQI